MRPHTAHLFSPVMAFSTTRAFSDLSSHPLSSGGAYAPLKKAAKELPDLQLTARHSGGRGSWKVILSEN